MRHGTSTLPADIFIVTSTIGIFTKLNSNFSYNGGFRNYETYALSWFGHFEIHWKKKFVESTKLECHGMPLSYVVN